MTFLLWEDNDSTQRAWRLSQHIATGTCTTLTLSSFLMQPKEFLFNMDRTLDDFTQNSPTLTNSAIAIIKSETTRPYRISHPSSNVTPSSSSPRYPVQCADSCSPLPPPALCPMSSFVLAVPSVRNTTALDVWMAVPPNSSFSVHISVTHHFLSKAFLCYPIKKFYLTFCLAFTTT